MNSSTYVRYEVLRNFRNWRFVAFSLAYPLALFFAVGLPNRHATFDGAAFPVYFMTAMATVGTVVAIVSTGARISVERSAGWTRQMRTTPLTARAHITAKVLCAYLMAILVIAALCLAGTTLGVRLSAAHWLMVIGMLLVGLVPFAVLGILLGHLIPADSMLPAVGGSVIVFCLLGGAYGFLIATSGAMFQVIRALPSYWLVQAGKTAAGGHGWPSQAWIVIAVWTVVLVPIAVLTYKRNTSRA
jgi:ABC-2 type transport system permease protein